jgi:hypothetical protein
MEAATPSACDRALAAVGTPTQMMLLKADGKPKHRRFFWVVADGSSSTVHWAKKRTNRSILNTYRGESGGKAENLTGVVDALPSSCGYHSGLGFEIRTSEGQLLVMADTPTVKDNWLLGLRLVTSSDSAPEQTAARAALAVPAQQVPATIATGAVVQQQATAAGGREPDAPSLPARRRVDTVYHCEFCNHYSGDYEVVEQHEIGCPYRSAGESIGHRGGPRLAAALPDGRWRSPPLPASASSSTADPRRSGGRVEPPPPPRTTRTATSHGYHSHSYHPGIGNGNGIEQQRWRQQQQQQQHGTGAPSGWGAPRTSPRSSSGGGGLRWVAAGDVRRPHRVITPPRTRLEAKRVLRERGLELHVAMERTLAAEQERTRVLQELEYQRGYAEGLSLGSLSLSPEDAGGGGKVRAVLGAASPQSIAEPEPEPELRQDAPTLRTSTPPRAELSAAAATAGQQLRLFRSPDSVALESTQSPHGQPSPVRHPSRGRRRQQQQQQPQQQQQHTAAVQLDATTARPELHTSERARTHAPTPAAPSAAAPLTLSSHTASPSSSRPVPAGQQGPGPLSPAAAAALALFPSAPLEWLSPPAADATPPPSQHSGEAPWGPRVAAGSVQQQQQQQQQQQPGGSVAAVAPTTTRRSPRRCAIDL